MKILLTLVLLFGFLFAEGDVKKVVIDLTTSDVESFQQKILKGIVAHKTHYESVLEELDVAVIIHGGAYKYFVKDLNASIYKDDAKLQKIHQDLKKRIRTLFDTYDVNFLMCASGMKKHGLDKSKILDFVKTVPNAAVGLIDKQNDGYAYLPVGD